MKILSMRATFGKLEHDTLTLNPDLNIVEAPNEWGKSTWCAFLIAMLYGVDTRTKSSKAQLSDRERYAPWSGAPMEGSMDLIWKDRKITIQRSTRGRIPMGEFHAFESESGLEVPELTAENCGKQLLGVEKAVFSRSGFLRFSDLPVTDHEQLRSRLNALVTTGDDRESSIQLDQKLKELKNRCQYNRSGLLPQARQEKQQLENQLQLRQSLLTQEEKLVKRIKELEAHIAKLNNHQAVLHYTHVQPQEEQLLLSQEAVSHAQTQLDEIEAQCNSSPSQEEAFRNIQQLDHLRQVVKSIEMEEQMLPSLPSPPEPPAGFDGCSPRSALAQAQAHQTEIQVQRSKKSILPPILLGLGTALLLCTAYLAIFPGSRWHFLTAFGGLICLTAGVITSLITRHRISRCRIRQLTLARYYGSNNPDQWVADAQAYCDAWEIYHRRLEACKALRGNLDMRKRTALSQGMALSNSKGIDTALEYWNSILDLWEAHGDAQRQLLHKQRHLHLLQSMSASTTAPEFPDTLDFTEEETNRLLSDGNHELRQLLSKLGQCRGQLEAINQGYALEQQLQKAETRIVQLERTYKALEYAQKALAEATDQLQRKFAPHIVKTTHELFAQLTGGRYHHVQISQNLSLEIRALEEDVLRSHRWRSDGTVDQLYLSLRLAVAQALMTEGPIILDDAMIRFDDQRLKAALNVLKDQSRHRQVILFTCQSRERQLLEAIEA